ncbi:NAD(P)/FAD-dependent oxidoreductase [Agromyces aerolatus]|uniref:NAD(P)/FAD-dependent oxidoreductase n=1 Tax=Agromyces sp. LY-1074 TaxID=3074080 RepID=UPI00285C9451|nr:MULTISPECIES: NAD(P)/FAD-dependent oxidoreductase [unclassified Agromyces]MDR5699632.1 NAD(P)/FAD-dependent oxidoreductase [Agromyces sp. LY-1074]MDR5705928.1 NAD(P)/FAD-dependent oxidoreductase [Agromyces sp. LY-1358]
MQHTTWDVIIAGGGSAGLSAALMLGRSRRRVLVIDEGAPRNRFAGHMHGVLGRDHTSPLDLLEAGRAELGRYDGVVIRSGEIVEAAGDLERGFTVTLADGERHEGRRMLLATGLRDALPDVPGLAEQWGRGAFLCPYCDGWEQRDRRIAVLATTPAYVHATQLLRQLSANVTFFAHGFELAPEARQGLVARGVAVEDRPVDRVLADGTGAVRGIRLADGRELDADVIFVSPTPEPNDALARALGADFATGPDGVDWVQVDAMGRTSVPGLSAAGNLTDGRSSVPYALSAGSMAGAMLNADLVEEEVRAAVAASPYAL